MPRTYGEVAALANAQLVRPDFSWPPRVDDRFVADQGKWSSLVADFPEWTNVVCQTYVSRGSKWRLQNHAPQASWRRPHNPPRRRAGHAR